MHEKRGKIKVEAPPSFYWSANTHKFWFSHGAFLHWSFFVVAFIAFYGSFFHAFMQFFSYRIFRSLIRSFINILSPVNFYAAKFLLERFKKIKRIRAWFVVFAFVLVQTCLWYFCVIYTPFRICDVFMHGFMAGVEHKKSRTNK